jgi:hypothetical protein
MNIIESYSRFTSGLQEIERGIIDGWPRHRGPKLSVAQRQRMAAPAKRRIRQDLQVLCQVLLGLSARGEN